MLVRPDLADRSFAITLQPITGAHRSEEELEERFAAMLPGVLGDQLSHVSRGLAGRKTVQVDRPSRLADAVRFIVASEPQGENRFVKALYRNKNAVYELAI